MRTTNLKMYKYDWKWEKAKHYRKTTEGHYVKWYLDRYGFGTEENLAKLLAGKLLVHHGSHMDETGKLATFATPLLLALVMVEFVDLVFAVDSIPAIFAITTDPFIVYTSNIFAILGLRSLYFALASLLRDFHYLKYSLIVVLAFVGVVGLWGIAFFTPDLQREVFGPEYKASAAAMG